MASAEALSGTVRVLDRYLAGTVVASSLLVLAVLVATFSFFQFINEAQDTGRGDYGLMQAALFVLFSLPRLTYEMFPIAALIGSLLGLSRLAANSELTVMRAAGVSLPRLVRGAMTGAALVVVLALAVGEIVAPPSEQHATALRSIALSNQIALKTRDGFWARDGRSFVNIRRVLPGNRVEDIYIYEFDEQSRLVSSTYARSATYGDRRWTLHDIARTTLAGDTIQSRHFDAMDWDAMLRPELISIVAVTPSSLSIVDLIDYMHYLKINNQNTRRYELALWVKLTYPIATAAMVFLAIPLVLGARRGVVPGSRIIIGVLIGLSFHIATQAAANLGLLLEMNPALLTSLPTLFTLSAAALLMRRVR